MQWYIANEDFKNKQMKQKVLIKLAGSDVYNKHIKINTILFYILFQIVVLKF